MNEAALKVIQCLGGGKNARLVGGCVRNHLMGKPITDIDIATTHTPEKVTEILQGQGIKVIPTGIDHGTVTAVLNKENVEITTLRKDIDTDGRHAKVEFSTSWEEDAQRRDFTMNTLLMDEQNRIYDPTGQGKEDIENRRVIFVGDAEQRIKEDILRILRFFRFNAIYGAGEVDQTALAACAKYADSIKDLSKERITQEFLKIIMAERAEEMLALMHTHKIMPELTTIKHHNFDSLSLIGRLFALSHEIETQEQYLRLSNKQKNRFNEIFKAMQFGAYSLQKQIKKAVYYHGKDAALDAYYLTIKDASAENIEFIQNAKIPKFPITGVDLIKEGYEQNEDLGKELKRREKQWVENDFKF